MFWSVAPSVPISKIIESLFKPIFFLRLLFFHIPRNEAKPDVEHSPASIFVLPPPPSDKNFINGPTALSEIVVQKLSVGFKISHATSDTSPVPLHR